MREINLLPPWIRQRERRKRIIRILVAAQVAVFILLGGTAFAMRSIEDREREQSALLSRQIAALDIDPLINAEAERETGEIRLSFSGTFNPEWLDAIIGSTPHGVHLTLIDYTGAAIILTAYADDLADITAHQARLDETESFGPILLGQLNRMEDGRVRYTLRLDIKP